MNLKNKFSNINKLPLFKDSFWAVFGNGVGNFLMLISGVLIARIIGKDLYGEYGMVKSTMFMMALFSTFALGDTSTKFIAEYMQKDMNCIKSIVSASIKIVSLVSIFTCLLLYLLAEQIALFVNQPQLEMSFQFLGIIIVFRALNTVGAGILGGFKDYKRIGLNNIISGFIMLILSVPLSQEYGIKGALGTLLMSQIFLALLNLFSVYVHQRLLESKKNRHFEKELVVFSFPFALNEFIFAFFSWGTNLLLAKYSSLGELGMYTACMQWYAIILFIPNLLGNVILSYLSTSAASDMNQHDRLIKKMLLINFLCTVFTLICVLPFSSYIVDYYGPTFNGMLIVFVLCVCGALFPCLTRVYQSNLTSVGKKWLAFIIRSSHLVIQFLLMIVILKFTNGYNAALNFSILALIMNFVIFLVYEEVYRIHLKNL